MIKKGGPRKMKKKNTTFLFILIFLVIFTLIFQFIVWDSFAQIRTEVGKSNGWREIRFNINTHSGPNWCASGRYFVVGGGGGTGIRLVDISSGDIQEITNNVRHRNPSCSHGGRYIFFTDSLPGEYKNLYVYNAKTKEIFSIYSLGEPLPVIKLDEPLSPSGKYLIGPDNWKDQITLPGGEIVTIVPIREIVEIDKPIGNFRIEWSLDSGRLYLLNVSGQILFIRDLKSNNQKIVQLKIGGFEITKIKPSPNDSRLFINAVSDEKKVANLYVMDLKNPEEAPKLFIENVFDFDIDSYGTFVFSRIYRGINHIHNHLYLADSSGGVSFINRYFFFNWPIIPHISRDGKAIAFWQKLKADQKVITVLVRDNK
jgi:hypothetical protein